MLIKITIDSITRNPEHGGVNRDSPSGNGAECSFLSNTGTILYPTFGKVLELLAFWWDLMGGLKTSMVEDHLPIELFFCSYL